jgi:AraC-like DNA-binding protein
VLDYKDNLLVEMPRVISSLRVNSINPFPRSYIHEQMTSLFYMKEGRGTCHIDQHTYVVKAGDLVIIHPGIKCNMIISEVQQIHGIFITCFVHIKGKDKGLFVDNGRCPVVNMGKEYQLVEHHFEAICQEGENQIAGFQEMTYGLIQTITILIIRRLEETLAAGPLTMSQTVKEYIDKYYIKELTLSDLAKIVHVSPYHLAHVYKQDLGMAPIQYMIHCRIEEAKRLLLNSDCSIKDISIDVGYPNANYFNQIFKKLVGLSPGKFRSHSTSLR